MAAFGQGLLNVSPGRSYCAEGTSPDCQAVPSAEALAAELHSTLAGEAPSVASLQWVLAVAAWYR